MSDGFIYAKAGEWVSVGTYQRLERENAALQAQLDAVRAQHERVWQHCKIIYWPGNGAYPIEHAPAALKDGRIFIEQALAALDEAKEADAT